MMKIKSVLSISLILCFMIGGMAQKPTKMQTYSLKWEAIEKLESEGKPQSAIKLLDEVITQADKENNIGQSLKALMKRSDMRNQINTEDQYLIFKELDDLLLETKDKLGKSIIHSFLSTAYATYYLNYRWEIDNKTALGDFIPEDIAEWPTNIYKDKIRYHVNESLKDKVSLLQVPVTKYEGVIELGVDSREYYPTLYDFLMKQGISVLENISDISKSKRETIGDVDLFLAADIETDDLVLKYYKIFLKNLLDRNLENTFILTELNRLEYLLRLNNNFSKLEYLENLEKKYVDKEISLDIILNIFESVREKSGYFENESNDQENLKTQYDWLVKGINRFPDSKKVLILKNKLKELENPFVRADFESVFYPAKEKTIKITYRNKKEVTLKVKDAKGSIVLNKKLILTPSPTYLMQDTTISVPLETIGLYTVTLESKKENREFRISQLLSLSRTFNGKEYEFFVCDRFSGKPLDEVTVEVATAASWNGNKTLVEKLKTDKQGFAKFMKRSDSENLYYYYRVIGNNNDITAYSEFPWYYDRPGQVDVDQEKANLFTDRSVYRPGQTIYFKSIVYTTKGQESALLINKPVEVILQNVGGQVIGSKTLTTNEFGSVSGEFILPKSTLNGQFHMRTSKGGYASIRVEEYKRPTFEVKFDKNKETYSFGDKISLKGLVESYSGVKLQGAKVSYTIERQMLYYRLSGSDTFVDSGEILTDSDGTFAIDFQIPEKSKRRNNVRPFFPETYLYSITANVLDENGEIQVGTTTIYVSDVSMRLSMDLFDKFNKKSGQDITISAQNLSGASLEASGNIAISRISKNDTVLVSNLEFKTGRQEALKKYLKTLESGEYLLQLTSKDDKDREINAEYSVVVFSPEDKRPPVETNEWIVINDSLFTHSINFSPTEPAKIAIGASAKDVTIIYDIISEDNRLLKRELLAISNSIQEIEIAYKEEYRNSITTKFTYIIDEKIYEQTVQLNKDEEPNKLQMRFEVFRDKLRPGSQEEWCINILNSKKESVMAEVLASMYDRSIDKIWQTADWIFNPNPFIYYNISRLNSDNTRGNMINLSKYDKVNYLTPYNYQFDYFTSFYPRGIDEIVLERALLAPAPLRNEAMGTAKMMVRGISTMSAVEDASALKEEEVSGGDQDQDKDRTILDVQLRQNFNETAFFYPHLRTNTKGEVIISFTVPESNTSWKFRALAYDKSLNVGVVDTIVVTKKELMVTPNAPRFLREGDEASISAKVSNLSEKVMNGKVRLEFFNPLTDGLINLKLNDQIQHYSMEKDESTVVQWMFDVPQGIDLIGYRIIADSETFSDGEQHVLSVLPNRILVTESKPIDVLKEGKTEFVFDRFLNSKSKAADDYRLTFEYTSNPAWYAIQALPVLSNPTNENSVNWFASYYANTLATYILKKYPKLEAMIKAWQASGNTAESLLSNLEKNEELKNILLEETPWVMEAKNESEQMQRLSLLFDLNRTASVTNLAIDKLADLQTTDGAWTWNKGGYPSRSMTQYILFGFSSLVDLNAVEYPEKVKLMQMSALKFIDKAILDDFDKLKKNNKEWVKTKTLSTNQLEYLYVRSSYRDIPINKETRDAERFYTTVAEQNWKNLDTYERSLLLVLAKRNGNKDLAKKIFESLKEYATVKEYLGMYWDNTSSRRSFISSSSTPVHVFLMKAFVEMGAPNDEMNLMKQWLLTQKRTQVWESTHATIDAINILLATGDDWLSVENNNKVKVGGKTLDMTNVEKGTGYIKQSWMQSDIKRNLAKVEVEKNSSVPSFGGMYWQYFEDLNNVKQQKTNLSVDKKLFKERILGNEKKLFEISSENPLKVGDKVVVRLTVRADRDFEFVHLKDMRASCFEPSEMTSGRKWNAGTSFYQETKDVSTNFFFDHLAKGTYVLEYTVYVNRTGHYSNGITTIQCLYAPEFTSHTSGLKVEVGK